MTTATGILNDRGVDQYEAHGPALLGVGGRQPGSGPLAPGRSGTQRAALRNPLTIPAPPPPQGPQSRPSCVSLCSEFLSLSGLPVRSGLMGVPRCLGPPQGPLPPTAPHCPSSTQTEQPLPGYPWPSHWILPQAWISGSTEQLPPPSPRSWIEAFACASPGIHSHLAIVSLGTILNLLKSTGLCPG